MKKRKITRIFIIVFVILTLNICLAPIVLGSTFDPNAWRPNTTGTNMSFLQNPANRIMGIIRVIGTIVAVVVLAIIGIKYMTGSVQEKAEYKKTMGPYLIGAVMLFAASNLVQIIYNWAITL